MKKKYLSPELVSDSLVLEDCLLEVSGRSSDMDYEENTQIGWTY